MQVSIRNNQYSIFLKKDEVIKIAGGCSLEGKLIEEEDPHRETNKVVYLRFGGNRKGIVVDFNDKREQNKIYLRVNKEGKRRLIAGNPILERYYNGNIIIQVE